MLSEEALVWKLRKFLVEETLLECFSWNYSVGVGGDDGMVG